jgi:YHS domain-containing protein
MATDPVCGMSVAPAQAAGSFSFEGRTYHFCSQHCLDAFKADPKRYLSDKRHYGGAGGTGRWVFVGFPLIAGYFLITEHRAHVIQALPFLLLLACPLLHLFHGHGGHGGHGDDKEKKQ